MVKKAETKKTTSKQTGVKSVGKTETKPGTSKLKDYWHNNWQAILILVALIGVLGFIGINQLIIYNQKQQFKAAEESLDKLYAEIVLKVGQPTSVSKDKSCGYASTEIGRGRRGCGVSIKANYAYITDIQSSKLVASKIENLIKNSKTIKVINRYDGYMTPADRLDISNDLSLNSIPLNCYASYSFNDIASNTKNLVFNLGCATNSAKAEFYPVTD